MRRTKESKSDCAQKIDGAKEATRRLLENKKREGNLRPSIIYTVPTHPLQSIHLGGANLPSSSRLGGEIAPSQTSTGLAKRCCASDAKSRGAGWNIARRFYCQENVAISSLVGRFGRPDPQPATCNVVRTWEYGCFEHMIRTALGAVEIGVAGRSDGRSLRPVSGILTTPIAARRTENCSMRSPSRGNRRGQIVRCPAKH